MALVNQATNAFSRLANLSLYRQLGLMLGLAMSVAIGVAVVLWSQEPSYVPVFSQISNRDAAAVTDALQKNSIPFKMDQGLIMVPLNYLQQARLKLAQEGLPRENFHNSYDFLDNANAFNTSQFMENARYKLALEQELARTISQFHTIKSARVHLAIPRESAFVRDQRESSASVFLDVYSNNDIPKRMVASIVNLVASSVPNLKASRVTLVDQNGRLFNEGMGHNPLSQTERMLDYRQTIEQEYAQKILDILTPILGYGRVQARVSADTDFTAHEQTQELYTPQKGAVRSEQLTEEKHQNSEEASGIPGALSNNPPASAKPVAKKPGDNAQANGEDANASKDYRKHSTRNYELDRTVSHTRHQPGSIRRLSVAVLVDNKPVYNQKTKKMESAPLKPEEITQIKLLISDAVGLNSKRGDSLNVVNTHFVQPESAEPLPPVKFWENEGFWSIVKQVFAALFVLMLVFGLLRPMFKSLAGDPTERRKNKALTDESEEAQALMSNPNDYEGQIVLLRQIVNKEPKRVAQVVKNWVERG